jgi:DNA-binding beta-propeller fold protein YncE
VVDLDLWKVVKAWGKQDIGQYGCGFAPSPDANELYVTSGDMTSSWLYVLDVSGADPRLVARHNLSSRGQDAHGLAVDPVRRELWIAHRVSGNLTVHPLAAIRNADHPVTVVTGVGKAPDLIAFSPDHTRAYVTLRGPKPAPTIPHAAVGETPGVAIIDVAGRRVIQVVKLGNQETGDFHGIFVPRSN